ncbi:transposase [Orenia metallireducens]|uniref:Transposase n=1 Tax=Orenia metallireducens TaxID=1413210 RepID=A0A1C0A7M7_9FIRM|nr:IS982 family transposase [Orenia metallireducens]OCL26218.1 transposase [Orenia metallireducens]OCL27290.1 transposase [Orenia metallireducens]
MLESNNYYTIEIENLRDFITIIYVIIDDIYQEVTPTHIKERRNIDKAILSDSEIITISIVGESLTIDSEKSWFNFVKKNLKDLFPEVCHRTRFNRTLRNLHAVLDEIRKKLTLILNYQYDNYRIVDSMPIPVCEFARAHFNKTFSEAEYGNCASKKETYFGFKLHALVTLNGYITDFNLTPANVDDRETLWELTSPYHSLKIIGDKGYISNDLNDILKDEKNIDLIPIKRKNSKDPHPKAFKKIISKVRRRVETSFSQLDEQFNISNVLTKSLWGLTTKIKVKVLAHNLGYFINKTLGRTINIGRIKELIFG